MSSILGALFAVMVGLLAVVPIVRYEHTAAENQLVAATAGQFSQILRAANQYVQANYSALESVATAGAPATITVPMLQNTGYLSKAVSSLNPFGQTWTVQVLQPQAGALQALVLSNGGQEIPQVMAPSIAAQAGQDGGGFVPYNGQYGSLTPAAAQGAYGGWSLAMGGYANPGAGHLAGLVQTSEANQQQDYLYRNAVPGAPQLNTMNTDLNMGSNDIANVNNVTAAGTVTANKVVLPQGNSLHIAGQTIYGDGLNLALRTPGTVYVQTADGSGTAAPLNASTLSANQVTSYGNINAAGTISGANVTTPTAYMASNSSYGAVGTNAPSENGLSANLEVTNAESSMTASGLNGNYAQGWATASGAGFATNGSISAGQSMTAGGQIYAGQEISNGDVMRPGSVAALGSGCGIPGAMAAVNDGSGTLADCVNGTWRAMGGLFQNTYQTGSYGSGSAFSVGPPTSKPMFISSLCLSDAAPAGAQSEASIETANSSGRQAQAVGIGGVADYNFYDEPSVSAIIPAGDWANITVINATCSFEIVY